MDMKSKIFIEDKNCPFILQTPSVICERWVDDKEWYNRVNYVCSCQNTREMKGEI